MSDVLVERLDAVRNRLRRVHLLAGLAQSVLAFIGLIVAFFLLDYLVLSRTVDFGVVDVAIRALLVLGILGVTGYVVWRTVMRELRTTRSDDDIAMRVERSHPELHGRLISTVQLAREERTSDTMISQEMIEALAEETVSFTEAMDFAAIINRRTLTRFGIAALVVVAACLILGGTRRDYLHALAGRLALTSTTYPTAATILSVTPGATIGRGDDLTIEVVVDPTRSVPPSASLSLKGADGKVTEVPLAKVVDDPAHRTLFSTVIPKAIDDFSYRPLVLDARWPHWEQVHIIQRPAVKDVRLTAHYPAYLGRADEVSLVGDLRVPVGTTVDIQADFTKPLTGAVITATEHRRTPEGKADDHVETIPMTLAASQSQGTAHLTVTHDGEWSLALSDQAGFANADPISYTMTAIPDHAPTVDVLFPAQDHEAVKYASWPIHFIARDDHAVTKAELQWTVTDVDQTGSDSSSSATTSSDGNAAPATATVAPVVKSLDIPLPDGPQAQIELKKVAFDLSQTGATVGQRVTYWVAVDDNDQPVANHAESAHYTFTILDPATIEAEFAKKRADAMKTLQELKGKETDIDTTIHAINSQTP